MALYWRERTGEGQLVDTSIVNGGVHLNTDVWIGPDGSWSERPRTDSRQTGSRSALPALPDERRLDRGGLPRADPLGRAREGGARPRRPALRRSGRARPRNADALGRGAGAGSSPVADRRTTPSTCSTAPACRSRSPTRRTPGARGSTNRTSSPPGSSPTTSTRPTGASASSATSCTSRTRPARIGGPPPLLGQHSREVLTDLGYSAEEIDQLRERGVTIWPD